MPLESEAVQSNTKENTLGKFNLKKRESHKIWEQTTIINKRFHI